MHSNFSAVTTLETQCDASAPITVARRPRETTLLARRERLNVRPFLRSFLRQTNLKSAQSVVQNLAFELARRSDRPLPSHWLGRLSNALELPVPAQPLDPAYFAQWPAQVWTEPTLLGEALCLSRSTFIAKTSGRTTRAGRVSEGCVFTPASVARAMIQQVHVGPRRIVDPACGGGVFLLEAFERAFLRRREAGISPEQAARQALCHELSGCDIDPQALAVAEFSLRLSAFRLSGFSEDIPLDLRHIDALLPLNGLDGQCECIVGNPPFVEGRGLTTAQVSMLRDRFRVAATGKVNLFAVFVERALELLKPEGVLALILPATFKRNSRYKALRELLLENTIESIQPLDAEIFSGRAVETVILRVRKRPPAKGWRVELRDGRLPQAQLPVGPVLRFSDPLPLALRKQMEKMERHGVPLSSVCDVRDGISTGFQPFPLRLLGTKDGSDFIAQDGTRVAFNPDVHRKIIDGSEIHTYARIDWQNRYIEYDKRHEHEPAHPGRSFNCQLRDAKIYDRAEKILTRQTAKGLIATVDRERYFVRNSIHVTYPKAGQEISINALCACMNSEFYTRYLLALTGENGNVFPQVHIADIKRLPLLPGLLRPGAELERLGTELLKLHAQVKVDAHAIATLKAEVEALLSQAFEC